MFTSFPSVYSEAHAAIDSAFHLAAVAELQEAPAPAAADAGGWFDRLGRALAQWRGAVSSPEVGRWMH